MRKDVNNQVLKKVAVLMQLNAKKVIEIMGSESIVVSNSEARGWLYGQDHKNYRALGDDDLLLIMDCLIKKYRGDK